MEIVEPFCLPLGMSGGFGEWCRWLLIGILKNMQYKIREIDRNRERMGYSQRRLTMKEE